MDAKCAKSDQRRDRPLQAQSIACAVSARYELQPTTAS